jgi:glycosyltransferase involved in cell wall biosynthesis
MSPPVVAIVHLGRTAGMGAGQQVRSLTSIFEGAGARVAEIALRRDHPVRPLDLLHAPWGAIARGAAMPECLSWSHPSALAAVRALDPAVVICETARAYSPDMVSGRWHLVIDFVDRLSVSYRDRARIVGSPMRAAMFRALAVTADRFERHRLPPGVSSIAVGWTDAEALHADWVPITFELMTPANRATHDVLFFGNLSYPPNVEAVERLAHVWPEVVARRPGTTLLIAGARAVPRVRDTANRRGWTLIDGFDDLGELLASARLGVVPLVHASGIQCKVLEAAAAGLAQVVSPSAAAGLKPGFPLQLAADDAALVEEIVRLLDDDDARRRLGQASRHHFAERYTAPAWVDWARSVLASAPHS